MPVKITKKLNYKRFLPEVRKNWSKGVADEIKRAILGFMLRGTSPVKGGRWDSGKKSPINLKNTGKLHNSLRVLRTKDGGLSIWFRGYTVGNKKKYNLAEIHNELGSPNGKIRRMLPTEEGEQFKPSIFATVKAAIEKAIKKANK